MHALLRINLNMLSDPEAVQYFVQNVGSWPNGVHDVPSASAVLFFLLEKVIIPTY